MADTDNPEVKQFTVRDENGRDSVTIFLGPDVALVQTTKWPRDENGVVTGLGQSKTVALSRHSMIGLAYEILQAVK